MAGRSDWLGGVTAAAETWRKHMLGNLGRRPAQNQNQFDVPQPQTQPAEWYNAPQQGLMPIPTIQSPTFDIPTFNTAALRSPHGFTASRPFGVDIAQLNAAYGQSKQDVASRFQTGQQQSAPANSSTFDSGVIGGDASQARGLEGTRQWDDYIQRAAQQTDVPENVIRSIMGIESGGSADSVSSAGAMGLMQVMPFHFSEGENGMDPWTNILKGAQILADGYQRYGSWENSAAAYLGAIEQKSDGSWGPSSAADDYGTTGQIYVDLFKANMAALEGAADTSTGAANPRTAQAIQAAQSVIGTPYLWGGKEIGGFDCSGLVSWAFAQAGIDMSGNAEMQYNKTQRIDPTQLQPGDLIFYSFPMDSTNPAETSHINHVAIYLGNGQVLNATSNGDQVRISDANNPWYLQHVYGYGRVPSGGEMNPSEHTGVDIPLPAGTEVQTLKAGQVVAAGDDEQYGHYVVISDGKTICLHGHLDDDVLVEVGEHVQKDEPIGYVAAGREGVSTGPHVHIEVADAQGNPLDPWKYIERYR